MTELEYEKASRGPMNPVPNEYAWGTSTIATSAYTLSNPGTASEGIATNYSTTAGNCVYDETQNNISRVGIFAAHANNTGRITSGGSYYGIMELSGNLYERAVASGNPTGRLFTGLHGDGALDLSGDADVTNWPGTNATGVGFRGGHWYLDSAAARVSERLAAAFAYPNRSYFYGVRLARTQS